MEDRERKKGPGTQLWDIRTLNSEHEEEAAKETEEERPVRQKKTGRVLNGRPGRVAHRFGKAVPATGFHNLETVTDLDRWSG